MTTSVYLSRRALGALIRLGNLLCQGTPVCRALKPVAVSLRWMNCCIPLPIKIALICRVCCGVCPGCRTFCCVACWGWLAVGPGFRNCYKRLCA